MPTYNEANHDKRKTRYYDAKGNGRSMEPVDYYEREEKAVETANTSRRQLNEAPAKD